MCDELDDLLDSVLDEFEEIQAPKAVAEPVVDVKAALVREQQLEVVDEEEERKEVTVPQQQIEGAVDEAVLEKQLQDLLSELSKTDFAKSLENNNAGDDNNAKGMPSETELKALEDFFKQFSDKISATDAPAAFPAAGPTAPAPKDFNESLEAAMRMISEGAQEIKTGNSGEGGDDEFLEKLLEQFKGMDPNDQGSMDQMVETMMAEMLSKETLYPPIKHIVTLYPDYLEKHRAELKDEDLVQYEKQFDCFSQILRILDSTDADSTENKSKVMNLLTEVQEYGTPPKEVLAELMPGLQFDEDGNPKVSEGLPGMDADLFNAANGGQCQIM
jgi:peroxin-19